MKPLLSSIKLAVKKKMSSSRVESLSKRARCTQLELLSINPLLSLVGTELIMVKRPKATVSATSKSLQTPFLLGWAPPTSKSARLRVKRFFALG